MVDSAGQEILDMEPTFRKACKELGIENFDELWASVAGLVTLGKEEVKLLEESMGAAREFTGLLYAVGTIQNPQLRSCRKELVDFAKVYGPFMFVRGLKAGKESRDDDTVQDEG